MHKANISSVVLLCIVSLFGCASYKVIPQTDTFKVSGPELISAIDSAASKLRFEKDRKNDSVVVLFKPPIHSWNQALVIQVLTRIQDDRVLINSIGETYSSTATICRDANEYAYLFNSAVAQEIAFEQGVPKYSVKLPYKRWDRFALWTLLNPGAGMYYGSNTPFTKNLARKGGITVGAFDLAFLTMALWPEDPNLKFRTSITPRGIGITGLVLGRIVVPILYFFKMETYRELQNTPYYFDIDEFRKRVEAGVIIDF